MGHRAKGKGAKGIGQRKNLESNSFLFHALRRAPFSNGLTSALNAMLSALRPGGKAELMNVQPSLIVKIFLQVTRWRPAKVIIGHRLVRHPLIFLNRPVPRFEQNPRKRISGIFLLSHFGSHRIGTFTPSRSIAEQIGKFCEVPGGVISLVS